jgi:hypothetical protein
MLFGEERLDHASLLHVCRRVHIDEGGFILRGELPACGELWKAGTSPLLFQKSATPLLGWGVEFKKGMRG